MKTILGKAPAIFNGHKPPRAVDPYIEICIARDLHFDQEFKEGAKPSLNKWHA